MGLVFALSCRDHYRLESLEGVPMYTVGLDHRHLIKSFLLALTLFSISTEIDSEIGLGIIISQTTHRNLK